MSLLVLAALLSACGSSSKHSVSVTTATGSSAPAGSGITLQLLGGAQNLNATACGKQEPFEHYPAPAQVKYTGQVSPAPSGRWKVKIKLKLCNGKSFVDIASQKIVGQPSGRYDGVFAVSKPGYYSVRAELEGATPKPQSPKLYLKVS